MNKILDQNSHESRVGSADIAASLRKEVLTGAYQYREKLPAERRLAETYGVARGTIREALARLEDDKIIEVRAGSGAYVIHSGSEINLSPIEDANPLELIDARFALEPHMCRLAVLHGRRGDFDMLDQLCDNMERSSGDAAGFSNLDTEFHLMLANTTTNKLLIWIISQVASVRDQEEWRRMRQLTLDEHIIRHYNLQHRQIVNALRSREPELAATHMKEHLETARLSLTRAAET